MFRVLIAILALQLSIVGAIAQSQQPANMTTMPGTPIPSLTPEHLRVLDPNGKWQATGAIDPTTSVFMSTATGAVDVTSIGMAPGGQDNSPYVQKLMQTIGSNTFTLPGTTVKIPPQLGHTSYYYFPEPFQIARGARIDCGNTSINSGGPVVLLFAPGVDGMIQETGPLSFDLGFGQSDIRNCAIMSMGGGQGNFAGGVGSNVISGVYLRRLHARYCARFCISR